MSGFSARVGLLALVAMLAATLAAPRSAHALPAEFYGVNAGAVFGHPQADAQLDAMAANGLSVVRLDASWGAVEPAPPDPASGAHTYDWTSLDSIASAFGQRGLRWYPMLGYSAPWAASIPGDPFSAPTHVEDYAAFASAFARRYGVNGAFWSEHPELAARPVTAYEIWNEPNFDHFWTQQASAPEAYADLYVPTRQAIHSVDPAARVVVGGLTESNPGGFLRRMYRHRPEAARLVDAVGYHLYANADAAAAIDSVRRLRASLTALGAGAVPIEVTEAGWSSSALAEPVRASALSRLATELPSAGLGVTRLLPFQWASDPGSDPWLRGLAIYNDDATPTGAGTAYAAAIRAMLSGQGAVTARVASLRDQAARRRLRARQRAARRCFSLRSRRLASSRTRAARGRAARMCVAFRSRARGGSPRRSAAPAASPSSSRT